MRKSSAIGLAMLSAVLFGASTPAAKALLGELSPWLLAGLLYLGSGAGLGAVLIGRRLVGTGGSEAPIRAGDLPWLGGAVLSGGVAGPLLLMAGLAQTTASAASLLLNLEGLATMAIAWIVFRENVDTRLLAGAFSILLGAALLAWNGGTLGSMQGGAALIAGACLCWGVDNNLTRKISGADPMQIAAIKGLVAGVVNVGIGMSLGSARPQLATVAGASLVGLLGYGVSLMCFILALRHLGAARTGAYFSTAPFVGAGLGIGLLGEPTTPWFVAAAGLMAIGVWLHLTERHTHEHLHEAVEHEHAHWPDLHHRHDHEPDRTD